MKILTILATGAGQGKISNGMARGRDCILEANPDADITVYSWKEWQIIPKIAQDIAAKIEALGGEVRIIMAGHSWGVWFLLRLAKELFKHGINVHVLLSADGVNRPPAGTLIVPGNVRELRSWFQQKKSALIKGSKFSTGELTNHSIHTEVFVRHPFVDEVSEFQSALIEFATASL